MSLNLSLNRVLAEYPKASAEEFGRHSLADFIRNALAQEIESIVNEADRYKIVGSPGQGNWADVPWAGIFDKLITESAQSGYYLVYLIAEDCSGVYLSLNQGVTSLKAQYRAETKHVLKVKANDLLARIGNKSIDLIEGPINLSVSNKSGLGALYEAGSICAYYYKKNELPTDEILSQHLNKLLDLYLLLSSTESRFYGQVDAEEDEVDLMEENLIVLREHKRIERNKKLALKAKAIHGYKCKACGFDFERNYGVIGRGFIEAHHLTPLSMLKGQKVKLNPSTDFTVLCANCHRMIHKSEFVNKVEQFRAKYVVK
jgi:5-methylcytosine-specific restriction protein A